MKKVNIFLLTLLCVLCLLIGNANADIIIYDRLEGGSGDVENVLFNEPGLIAMGTTVQGILNQSRSIVDFTGIEQLYTPPGGQARIAAATDMSLSYLKINMHDTTQAFSKIQFNIDAATDGSVILTFKDQFGVTVSDTFPVGGAGQNWFTAIGFEGQVIADATINSDVEGVITGLADVQQIRIGLGGTTTVPEPSTMLLLGAGLIGLAAFSRKKLLK